MWRKSKDKCLAKSRALVAPAYNKDLSVTHSQRHTQTHSKRLNLQSDNFKYVHYSIFVLYNNVLFCIQKEILMYLLGSAPSVDPRPVLQSLGAAAYLEQL